MSTYTHPLAAQGTATTGAGLLEGEALGAAGVEGVWLGGGVVDVEGVGLTLGLGDSSITLTVSVMLSSRSPLAAAPCFSRPLITLVPGTRRRLGTVAVRAVVLLSTVLMTPVAYLDSQGQGQGQGQGSP